MVIGRARAAQAEVSKAAATGGRTMGSKGGIAGSEPHTHTTQHTKRRLCSAGRPERMISSRCYANHRGLSSALSAKASSSVALSAAASRRFALLLAGGGVAAMHCACAWGEHGIPSAPPPLPAFCHLSKIILPFFRPFFGVMFVMDSYGWGPGCA